MISDVEFVGLIKSVSKGSENGFARSYLSRSDIVVASLHVVSNTEALLCRCSALAVTIYRVWLQTQHTSSTCLSSKVRCACWSCRDLLCICSALTVLKISPLHLNSCARLDLGIKLSPLERLSRALCPYILLIFMLCYVVLCWSVDKFKSCLDPG